MNQDEQFRNEAGQTAEKQIELQNQIDKIDRKSKEEEEEKPMQAGAREYPVPPVAKQHLEKWENARPAQSFGRE